MFYTTLVSYRNVTVPSWTPRLINNSNKEQSCKEHESSTPCPSGNRLPLRSTRWWPCSSRRPGTKLTLRSIHKAKRNATEWWDHTGVMWKSTTITHSADPMTHALILYHDLPWSETNLNRLWPSMSNDHSWELRHGADNWLVYRSAFKWSLDLRHYIYAGRVLVMLSVHTVLYSRCNDVLFYLHLCQVLSRNSTT